jgi:hypothetical protein
MLDIITYLIIYIVLLAITIVLVIMKKTHWGSIIGVALIPIYFIWVLIDIFKSGSKNDNTEKVLPPQDEEVTANKD